MTHLKQENSLEDLDLVLSLTIKHDYDTKNIMFLGCLLTYTDHDQINIIVGGESSIGKTYNVDQIMWFFPRDDVLSFEGASKTSFIHEDSAILVDARNLKPIQFSQKPVKGDPQEKWEQWYEVWRNKAFFMNYGRKLIVLPDMPDTKLLSTLRSLLSHDKRICKYKTTEARTLKTKKAMIQGFFTTIFCSASTEIDEQEVSRNMLLTPEFSKEKIIESLKLINRKNSDPKFNQWYENDPTRVALKKHVQDIKDAEIDEIYISSELLDKLLEWFNDKVKTHKPKESRDYQRVICLAKAWALFNFDNRKREGNKLFAEPKDVEVAEKLYEKIIESNSVGVSPECWSFYQKVVLPLITNDVGATIDNFHAQYFTVHSRQCSDYRLRGMLKNLENVGLVTKDTSEKPHRYRLTKGDD